MRTFDPVGAFRTLVEHEVTFVVIGGLAGTIYGSPTVTNDADICHDRDLENLERLARALRAMNASLRGAASEVEFLLDAESLRKGMNFTFSTDFGALDCFGLPSGVAGYAELIANAEDHDLEGFSVKVCSLEDLMTMKQASGRPKDRIELEVLAAVREERHRPG